MSEKINIEDILKKHYSAPPHDMDMIVVKAAIKEIVEAVVDRCKESANVIVDDADYGCTCMIDEESIENVKQEVDYA